MFLDFVRESQTFKLFMENVAEIIPSTQRKLADYSRFAGRFRVQRLQRFAEIRRIERTTIVTESYDAKIVR